jgi:ribosome-associated translation inhibitor RaiA
MAVSARDRRVFHNIAQAEASRATTPSSFDEALQTLERLIRRRRSLFGRHPPPDDEEFRSHERIYAQARD